MFSELWSLLVKDLEWNKRTAKQRVIIVWFGLSFCLLAFGDESLIIAIPVLLNFAAAAYSVAKHVPVTEE